MLPIENARSARAAVIQPQNPWVCIPPHLFLIHESTDYRQPAQQEQAQSHIRRSDTPLGIEDATSDLNRPSDARRLNGADIQWQSSVRD